MQSVTAAYWLKLGSLAVVLASLVLLSDQTFRAEKRSNGNNWKQTRRFVSNCFHSAVPLFPFRNVKSLILRGQIFRPIECPHLRRRQPYFSARAAAVKALLAGSASEAKNSFKFNLTPISPSLTGLASTLRHTTVHNGSLQSQNLRKMGCNEFVMLGSC